MKTELINKTDIKVVGLTVRTNNQNEMNPATAKIGGLIGRYMAENMANTIPNRVNPGVMLSIYTDYASNEQGDYTYFVGEEVDSFANVPDGLSQLTISASKYQKFTTPAGKMPEVVLSAWQQIWQMSASDLGGERAYRADFEVYDQRAMDPTNTSLDIYIGIK